VPPRIIPDRKNPMDNSPEKSNQRIIPLKDNPSEGSIPRIVPDRKYSKLRIIPDRMKPYDHFPKVLIQAKILREIKDKSWKELTQDTSLKDSYPRYFPVLVVIKEKRAQESE